MEDDDVDPSRELEHVAVSAEVIAAFENHADHLRDRKRKRASELQLRSHLEADQAVVVSSHDAGDSERVVDEDSFGVWKPGDVWQGDVCLRTLHDLLLKIDREGYERSSQQVEFHEAFILACGRVLYKRDWELHKPAIMTKNQWTDSKSEVMVSTPRRFGKTFSVAMFVACIALAATLDVVIFSPARRASRKLLERVVQFMRTVGCGDKIVEYNQEQCRCKNYAGGESLIRSFPSKVDVRRLDSLFLSIHCTHTSVHAHERRRGGPLKTHCHHGAHCTALVACGQHSAATLVVVYDIEVCDREQSKWCVLLKLVLLTVTPRPRSCHSWTSPNKWRTRSLKNTALVGTISYSHPSQSSLTSCTPACIRHGVASSNAASLIVDTHAFACARPQGLPIRTARLLVVSSLDATNSRPLLSVCRARWCGVTRPRRRCSKRFHTRNRNVVASGSNACTRSSGYRIASNIAVVPTWLPISNMTGSTPRWFGKRASPYPSYAISRTTRRRIIVSERLEYSEILGPLDMPTRVCCASLSTDNGSPSTITSGCSCSLEKFDSGRIVVRFSTAKSTSTGEFDDTHFPNLAIVTHCLAHCKASLRMLCWYPMTCVQDNCINNSLNLSMSCPYDRDRGTIAISCVI